MPVLGGAWEDDHQAGEECKVSGGPPGHTAGAEHQRMSYTCQSQQQKPLPPAEFSQHALLRGRTSVLTVKARRLWGFCPLAHSSCLWVNLELKSTKLITSIDTLGAFEESWIHTCMATYIHACVRMYTNPPCRGRGELLECSQTPTEEHDSWFPGGQKKASISHSTRGGGQDGVKELTMRLSKILS